MPKPFRLVVLTPEYEFYDGEAVYVGFETIAGPIGVLADHTPMVSALGVGTLTIRLDANSLRTAFHSEGFIEVRADGVYVLSQACEWPEEIDEKRAIEAEQRAAERLAAHPGERSREMEHSRVALMRALTRRKIRKMSNSDTK